jgi:hypothetical protein
MKSRRLILAFAVLAAGLSAPAIAKADSQILSFPFSTSSASGTIGPLLPQGSGTCSITFASGGGAVVTVAGSANGSAFQTNSNFGTLGVITSPAAGSVYAGNVAAYPNGFQMAFTGNSGTLSGSVVCSRAMVAPVFGYNSAGPQEFMFPDGSVPVSIAATAGSTALVNGVAGKSIYLLGYNVSIAGGTNPTFSFGYGVGSCTSPTALTGIMGQQGGTSAVYSMAPSGVWLMKVPAGDYLCITSGGTTPSIYGYIEYAQLAGP